MPKNLKRKKRVKIPENSEKVAKIPKNPKKESIDLKIQNVKPKYLKMRE